MKLTPEQIMSVMRQYLCAFIQRCFHELKSETEYLHNFHVEVIAAELEKCLRGETKRLIINLPPRSLKSLCASVAFPAFILGHNPAANVICVSYGQDLADRLASDCRSVMDAAWYQDLFPDTRLAPGRRALSDFMTTCNGGRFSTSVRGSLTGRGGDFIIIDDPQKADEALSDLSRDSLNGWFDNTVTSRLNNKSTGCMILVMQRLHEDDLVGHLMKSGGWKVLKFPAIAEEDESYTIETIFGTRRFMRKVGEALHPAQEPLEALTHMRDTIGEYNFAGQYQQAPAPRGGGLIKCEWFTTYTPANLPENLDLIFQSWDTANKSSEQHDYNVCTTWGIKGENLYLLDVFRRRMEYPDLKRAVRDLKSKYRAKIILIEDHASGTPLIQELSREGISGITPWASKRDKFERLSTTSDLIEGGLVHLPEAAVWLDEYVHELVVFPRGQYDDQVDSTSQALDWFKNRQKFGVPPWVVYGARKFYEANGNLDEVKKIDEQYGAPPEKTKPEPVPVPEPEQPSGPAVFNGDKKEPIGPATFVSGQGADPTIMRLKRRSFFKRTTRDWEDVLARLGFVQTDE